MSKHILSFIGKRSTSGSAGEIPEIFPFSVVADVFCKTSLETTYNKILVDTFERTFGLDERIQHLLWDNCVQSENSKGLISLLVEAMVNTSDLFLVYLPSVDVLRKADSAEREQIKRDFQERGESNIGTYISFKNYRLTEILRIYAALEYCVIASFHKSVNLAKAVQIKAHELRSSVAVSDSAVAIAQAQAVADALRNGRDVLLDKNDEITTANPDITPTEKAIAFLDGKRSYVLNLPLAYVAGELARGLGDSGQADMRAIERGLKYFYFSIVKPVCKSLFKADVKFKSQDSEQMENAYEAMKTFDLVTDEYLSLETKRNIVWRLFDLDPTEEQKRLESVDANQSVSEEGETQESETTVTSDAETTMQDTTFNGAQVTSLVQVVTAAALGQIPRESAVKIVEVAYGLSPAEASAVLSNAGNGFTPTPVATVKPAAEPVDE